MAASLGLLGAAADAVAVVAGGGGGGCEDAVAGLPALGDAAPTAIAAASSKPSTVLAAAAAASAALQVSMAVVAPLSTVAVRTVAAGAVRAAQLVVNIPVRA